MRVFVSWQRRKPPNNVSHRKPGGAFGCTCVALPAGFGPLNLSVIRYRTQFARNDPMTVLLRLNRTLVAEARRQALDRGVTDREALGQLPRRAFAALVGLQQALAQVE